MSLPIKWGKSYDGYTDKKGKHEGFVTQSQKNINNFFANPDNKAYADAPDWLKFLTALGLIESGFDFGIVNQLGYLGKYQMGIGVLKDTGFFDKYKNPTDCVKDLKDFLKNPYAQEIAALRGRGGDVVKTIK